MRDEQSVEQRRKKLAEALEEHGERILIIIDDIDRLTAREVRELFQVIKALADLPYLTYLLAFDRDFVTEALKKVQVASGEDYLQKIVQSSFELPLPEPGAVHQLFFDRLANVLEDVPQEEADQDRLYLSNIFAEGLRHILVTPRQVTLLTNALSVTFPPVVGEVNRVDFIAIEALRLFHYPVYQAIRNNEAYFTTSQMSDPFDSSSPNAQTKLKEHCQFHERWLKQVDPSLRPHIKSMLQRMFPKLESIWKEPPLLTSDTGTYSRLRARLRICTEDYFQVYFRMGVPATDLSASELRDLLTLAKDPEAFGDRLLELAKQQP